MNNKIVMVTGASSGFGYVTTEKLLSLGYIVYACSRRLEKMKSLEAKGAKLIKMDVSKDQDVTKAVEKIISEQGKIDILYNNAGYGSYGTIENVPMDEIKYQYDVNVFGVARVLSAVLPHMRKKRAGRIVLTSSIASRLTTPGLGWYASTKYALLAMGTSLRQEVKALGIKVVMIQPGAVKTDFDDVAFKKMDTIDFPEDYIDLMKGFKKTSLDNFKKAPTAERTARIMLKAGITKNPKTIYNTTKEGPIFLTAHKFLSDKIFDNIVLNMIKKGIK